MCSIANPNFIRCHHCQKMQFHSLTVKYPYSCPECDWTKLLYFCGFKHLGIWQKEHETVKHTHMYVEEDADSGRRKIRYGRRP